MQFILNLNEYILQCQDKAKQNFPPGTPLEADVDLVVNELTGEVKVIVKIIPRMSEQQH